MYKEEEEKDDQMLVLTPSALLAFLSQIEELMDKDIEIVEGDATLTIKIGDSTYTIESPEESAVEVDDVAIEELDEINEEGYDEVDADDFTEVQEIEGEVIDGGIVKELIKTLAVGGLVRLTKNAIMKS